jgi:hypothetical protein
VKQLNYPGRLDSRAIGVVVGPTTTGEWLTIYAVEYDQAADKTMAHLRPATLPEFEAHHGVSA